MDRDLLHFAIGFHGQRFNLLMSERRWLFWTRTFVAEVGFYTTRFVLANDANEAIRVATEILANEVESRFEHSPDSVLNVDEVVVRNDEYTGHGHGFTFYGSDGEADTVIRKL